MDFIVFWFILTNGSGYLPPMDVRLTDNNVQCNLPGAIVGVQVNRLENPTIALWSDPTIPNRHCEVDISIKVASLPNGEYHNCTTIIGKEFPWNIKPTPYIPHDPHCSVYWLKSNFDPNKIPKVIGVRVAGQ